jgi:radical SAM superfamily enzyme YgiQ (UPF0313 family)
MGGLHVSVLPEEALGHADYVAVGEGENVWPEIVRAAGGGAAPQVFRASDFGAVDVAALPVPRYDLLGDRPYNRFTVQTSRGCPWRCDFCASTVMLTKRYRTRPVEAVMRDIDAVLAVRGRPFLEFADDNTFVDKRWSRELLRALAPRRLKWFTETDLSVADDEEVLRLLRPAGCRQVLVGLESPTRGAVEGVEMRGNFKARRAADAIESVRRIQRQGVTVNGCFVLGLDGQTVGDFEAILDFARSAPLYEVQVTLMTPFPGTPLRARLEREGRLLEAGHDWSRMTLFDVTFRPSAMTPVQLVEGLHRLTERLYAGEAVTERRRGVLADWRAWQRAGRECA